MYAQNDSIWPKELLADKEPSAAAEPSPFFEVGDEVENVYGKWKGKISQVLDKGFLVRRLGKNHPAGVPKEGCFYLWSQANYFRILKPATRKPPSRILNNDIFTAIVSRMPPTKDEKVFYRAKPRRPLRPFREAEPTDLVEFPEMPGKHWMVIGKAGWGEIQAICLETKIVDGISIWKEDRLGGPDRMADISKSEFAFEEVE